MKIAISKTQPLKSLNNLANNYSMKTTKSKAFSRSFNKSKKLGTNCKIKWVSRRKRSWPLRRTLITIIS